MKISFPCTSQFARNRSLGTPRDARGFVALAAILVICSTLVLAVIPSSLRWHLASLGATDAQMASVSRQLAYACLELAALRLRQSRTVVGTATVDAEAVPLTSCSVDEVLLTSSGHEVRVSAESPTRRGVRIRTRLRALISAQDYKIVEVHNLGSCDARDPPELGC